MFESNDKVRCINNSCLDVKLTLGCIYTVNHITTDPSGNPQIWLDGMNSWFAPWRFEKVTGMLDFKQKFIPGQGLIYVGEKKPGGPNTNDFCYCAGYDQTRPTFVILKGFEHMCFDQEQFVYANAVFEKKVKREFIIRITEIENGNWEWSVKHGTICATGQRKNPDEAVSAANYEIDYWINHVG